MTTAITRDAAGDATAYQRYVRENENWNFCVNMLDLTFYSFAWSFVFGTTVLPLYASYLTDSAILIGLVPTIQMIAPVLPQLLLARQAEQLSRKKPLIQKISVMERLPYLFVFLGILLWPEAPSWAAYAVLAISLMLATGAGGLAGPAWTAMLAKVVPVERRGLMFGLSRAFGGLLGVGGAAISRYVLEQYAYPLSFGICFLMAFVFQVASWICLSLNREPAREPTKAPVAPRDYWRNLPNILRDHPNFTRYLVARWLIVLGGMGTSFYVVYARQEFGVPAGFAASLTMVALISQTASTPLLGWVADRRGHKWILELCTTVSILSVVLVLAAPSALWMYAVFAFMNIATAGTFVSSLGIIMEFCGEDDVPTFSALAGTLTAVPIFLAPVLGGWLVETAGYATLFAVALIFGVAGWIAMRWLVREPRYE